MKIIFSSIILCLLSTQILAQCYLDRHNTSSDEAWITCTLQPNPNAIRGNSHWILYDFGSTQALGTTYFWNLNAADRTKGGIREAVIDYSLDGFTWIEWGTFELQEAPSSGFYEGENGPDLSGTNARMILITVLENYGDNCSGLSEIKIESFGEISSTNNLVLNNSSINVSPNPAIDYTILSIDVESAQSINLEILDASGRIIQKSMHSLTPGEQEFKLNLDYPEGQYLIKVDNGKETYTTKISIVSP